MDAITMRCIRVCDAGAAAAASAPDITVTDQGTIVCLTPQNTAARVWLEDNLDVNCARLGSTYGIEHRYLEAIVCYAIADGLLVKAA